MASKPQSCILIANRNQDVDQHARRCVLRQCWAYGWPPVTQCRSAMGQI